MRRFANPTIVDDGRFVGRTYRAIIVQGSRAAMRLFAISMTDIRSPTAAAAQRSAPWQEQGTPADEASVVIRDLRGWFYRLVVVDPRGPTLQIGDGFAENWLADVVRSESLPKSAGDLGDRVFDLVIMHYSLGGCDSLREAVVAASRVLRRGGRLAIAGHNRLRSGGHERADTRPPRATAWGYRAAMDAGGFTDVEVYVTHPPGDAPVYVVAADRRSATQYFRSMLAGRNQSHWSPARMVTRALIEINLMPLLQPGFLVVGVKC